jgi:hypothetical protein
MSRALVLAICLLLAGSACESESREGAVSGAGLPTSTTGADLVPLSEWQRVRSTLSVGGEMSPVAWSATSRFQSEDEGADFPDETVKALEAGGIVITVLGPRPFSRDAEFPQLFSAPLVISSDACVSEAYDGQPQPHIALCYLDRWVGPGHVLNVNIWFGTDGPGQAPTEAQVERANDELARLSLPGDGAAN